MSLQDKILKRKLKKKEKQKLKIIEDRKCNTNNDFVEETEMSSEEKLEVVGSDVENQGLKRKLDETIEDPETPIKSPKKKKKSESFLFAFTCEK